MSDHKEAKSFSRFGYIMVAAGAAIGPVSYTHLSQESLLH